MSHLVALTLNWDGESPWSFDVFNVTPIQVPLFLVIVIHCIDNILLTILKMFKSAKASIGKSQLHTLTIRQMVPPSICPAGNGVITSPCPFPFSWTDWLYLSWVIFSKLASTSSRVKRSNSSMLCRACKKVLFGLQF